MMDVHPSRAHTVLPLTRADWAVSAFVAVAMLAVLMAFALVAS